MDDELQIGDALRIDVEGCPPRVLNDYRFSRDAHVVSLNEIDGKKYVTVGWNDGWQVGVEVDVALKMRQKALNGVNTTKPELPQMELPERRAYFGMVYDGNKLEAHDVNVVHNLTLTSEERAYIHGVLDMAIHRIMEMRRAELGFNLSRVSSVSDAIGLGADRTETFIVIETVKREADNESKL